MGTAQMVTYEAKDVGVSSGWFYWTFKMEGGAFAEWNFLRGQDEGWIPKIPSPSVPSVDLYGSCLDIIFKTDDDESIIHEFPDPKSLDPTNWQGFSIDDDVVVSHGQSLKMDTAGEWYSPDSPSQGQYSMVFGIATVASFFSLIGIMRMTRRKFRQHNYSTIDDMKY